MAAASAHLLYLACSCPLNLVPDEAHYWDWSRHLDWSYYSKGPLVAYLIHVSCSLIGPWSQELVGSEMLAVRLPAVLCSSLLLVSLHCLTRQVYGREGLALAVVALTLTAPVIAVGSSLMTIDAPYTCCWGWALVLGYQAMVRRSAWCWPLLGLVVGLGILAKYTMVLWIASAGLYLLFTPAHRRLLLRPGFWIMTVIAGLCCTPVLVWNFQHDWVSFQHVSGQAGLHESSGVRWTGPLIYLGMQFGLLLGFWFVAWACAMIVHRPWRDSNAGVSYLWWMSAPVFGVFLLFSLKTSEEPNWPITTYLSGLVLAMAWLAEHLRSPTPWRRRTASACLGSACVLGCGVIAVMHRSDWLQPVLVAVSGPPTHKQPLPMRRFDPTCRLRGWQAALATEVDRLRRKLAAEGNEPILAGSSWTLPGELAFYCQGHPDVYSIGFALGDRHSQYDLWHPNPVWDSQAFAGRTFLIVGDINVVLQDSFDQVEPTQTVVYEENGLGIAQWKLTVCRGFHGFRHLAKLLDMARY